jgi:hypothetical protein
LVIFFFVVFPLNSPPNYKQEESITRNDLAFSSMGVAVVDHVSNATAS